jgi:hypothetical protein
MVALNTDNGNITTPTIPSRLEALEAAVAGKGGGKWVAPQGVLSVLQVGNGQGSMQTITSIASTQKPTLVLGTPGAAFGVSYVDATLAPPVGVDAEQVASYEVWFTESGGYPVALMVSAQTYKVTKLVRAANVVTLSVEGTHSLAVGQSIVVAGSDDATFDGTFQVAATALSTITYAQTAAAATSNGTRVVGKPVLRLQPLRPGIAYSVKARLYTRLGAVGDWTTPAGLTAATDTAAPLFAPTALRTAFGMNQIVVDFADVADPDVINANGYYEIDVDTAATFATANKRTTRSVGSLATIGGVTRAIADTWYLRVRAVDSSGNPGPYTATVSGVLGTISNLDILANSLTATQIKAGSITATELVSALSFAVGKTIKSGNWSGPGGLGWMIDGDGHAWFNGVYIAGEVHASSGSFTGTITASAIGGGTIDGATITGANIRTVAGPARRVELSGNAAYFYSGVAGEQPGAITTYWTGGSSVMDITVPRVPGYTGVLRLFSGAGDASSFIKIDDTSRVIDISANPAFNGGAIRVWDNQIWIQTTGNGVYLDINSGGFGFHNGPIVVTGAGGYIVTDTNTQQFNKWLWGWGNWDISQIYVSSRQGTGADCARIGIDALNVACVIGMKADADAFCVMNAIGSGYTAVWGGAYTNQSTIAIKDDVEPVADDAVLALAAQAQLHTFMLKAGSNIATELVELKAHVGQEPGEYVYRIHDCAVDNCAGTAAAPCGKTMSNTRSYGLIAEQVEGFAPEMVNYQGDRTLIGYEINQIATTALAGVGALVRRLDLALARITALEAA